MVCMNIYVFGYRKYVPLVFENFHQDESISNHCYCIFFFLIFSSFLQLCCVYMARAAAKTYHHAKSATYKLLTYN